MNANNCTNQKRAIIYCRVSTKEQVDEGGSLITQEKICRDYALKNNYEIAKIFIEQGESAKTTDRTELQKLLKYCADKRNEIGAVIVYKLDRLSRNTDDYSQIRLLLKHYNVEIKSTSEYFENTPVGRFMENMMANIAQFDNDVRAERSIGGMREAFNDGRYVWMAPIGYKNIKIGGKANIAQDEKVAPVVREVFELIGSNSIPTDAVRRMMVKTGLFNKKGKPISKSYFYRMLTNELYCGWMNKFGERRRGIFEPIVSEELFNQVQRILKYKGHKHSQHITDNPDFPLRRFVINTEGKKLTGSWSQGKKQKYPFYRFGGKGSNYNRDKFEEKFKSFMDKYSFDENLYNKLIKYAKKHLNKATEKQQKEAQRIKNSIAELQEKQSSLIDKNCKGIISDTILKQQLEIIDKELMSTNAGLASLPLNDTNFEELLLFVKDYITKPSKIWGETKKLDVKLKLQVFQFPSGCTFDGENFGTPEIACVFKAKDAFAASLSSGVASTGFEPVLPG